VGYDLESKGYRIYWPNKRSVTVERNVVFNPDDILTANDEVVIPGDVLAEGERDKVIQLPKANTNKKGENTDPDATLIDAPSNSIPFPPSNQTESHDSPDELSTGRSHHVQPAPGTYKRMHEGVPLHANVAQVDEPDNNADDIAGIELFANLPPDFALVGAMGYEPRTLDKAL
jgi:hypothetical protein